ncbi:DUF4926 domain-containing protein [Eikenella halliae]|uniref:DUF4926 domain-containing protein n=1 Tax=Eikenella halliae TaxID=1795832 RepID=UPI0028D6B6AA|nr:DUF4926 domain-containing protein [Eikenella halliae]
MPYQLLDVVELIRDLPEQRLRAGMRGAVVDRYGNDEYEVEFVGGNGETLALLALNGKSDLKRAAISENLPENPNKAAPVVGTVRQEAT